INVRSMTFPISPPRASTSFTRCPFDVPPIFGLHGIIATLSMLTVKTIVLIPSLAAARAASQPACPAPITATSYTSLFSHTEFTEYFINQILSYRFSRNTSKCFVCIHQINRIKILRHAVFDTSFYLFQACKGLFQSLFLSHIRNIAFIIKSNLAPEKHLLYGLFQFVDS